MKDQLLAAFGAGFGLAVLFFPLTWLAMRKQFQLRPLRRYGWQFATVVVAAGAASSLGFLGGLLSICVPITVCALLLFYTKPKA